MTKPPPIPLIHPDITREEGARLLADPGGVTDATLTALWERAWSVSWQRPVVAFARAGELVATLAGVLGWEPGTTLAASALLDPVWQEALNQAWLPLTWLDIDPITGIAVDTAARITLHLHPFGLPAPLPASGLVIEEISGLPHPLPGVGQGDFQVVRGDGNALFQAGNACLLLGSDEQVMAELARRRPRLPAVAACRLGLMQRENAPVNMARRHALAARYRALLRPRGRFVPPGKGNRGWENFTLWMNNDVERDDLVGFLDKSRIAAGDPVWWAAPGLLPGLATYRRHALALPLYAALSDGAQKRIINRVQRWVERRD